MDIEHATMQRVATLVYIIEVKDALARLETATTTYRLSQVDAAIRRADDVARRYGLDVRLIREGLGVDDAVRAARIRSRQR